MGTVRALALAIVWTAGCAAGAPPAATLDTHNEACRFCRMVISDQAFASQIVGLGEEPLFFDDPGCLRSFLDGAPKLAAGSVTYVADHRTKAWVRADAAVFVESVSATAPMGSHVLAYATPASRDADPDAKGGRALTLDAVVGAHGLQGGK